MSEVLSHFAPTTPHFRIPGTLDHPACPPPVTVFVSLGDTQHLSDWPWIPECCLLWAQPRGLCPAR